jgi:hypothetical protein
MVFNSSWLRRLPGRGPRVPPAYSNHAAIRVARPLNFNN